MLRVNFSPESNEAQAFRQELRDVGYVEGSDVVIEWRTASGDCARVPELVVNLKTAKTLGITIPESVLLRADEVIR